MFGLVMGMNVFCECDACGFWEGWGLEFDHRHLLGLDRGEVVKGRLFTYTGFELCS